MRTAFLLVGAAWFAMMAGSNLATPLYAVYERKFGFSSAVPTIVFATYALVLAPSLLVFGQLSDRIGRRRVMAAGFVTATLGLVAFALAPPDRRGEVNAAFYTLICLGVATTVISTGLVTLTAPLSTAITSFCVVTGAIAIATAAWHVKPALAAWRARRAPPR